MKLPPFDYACPTSLEDAIAILAESSGEARLLAGGQSLLPVMAFRLASPKMLVDLRRIPGLRDIAVGANGVRLGAMTRWRDIAMDARLAREFPLLPAAIDHVAHYQIQNRGTVGGSLAHADPAAEFPGIAVACDAIVETASGDGEREIAAGDLLVGALETSLKPDEIITGVRFPAWPKERRWTFEEFARRRGDFALAAVVAHYDVACDGVVSAAHIGVIGATDRPRRLSAAEDALNGRLLDEQAVARAASLAARAVDPPNDLHGSAAYRRALVSTLLTRGLRKTMIGMAA